MTSRNRGSPASVADPVTHYAQEVAAGRIVAGPHVRDACSRHLRDLVEGGARGLVWDVDEANETFRFYSEILRLNGGDFEGRPFELHISQQFIVGSLFGWKRVDGYRRFRVAYIEEGKGNGKALAVDTPIPTPGGWTTMGALQAGDLVLDERGAPCRVVAAHPVSDDRGCFRVQFDDGEQIVASAEHLWRTEMRRSPERGRSALKGLRRAEHGAWRDAVRTTAEIARTLRYANGGYQSANHSIALAGVLDLPERSLPIDPYLLGVWLGDGDSDCARITIGPQDRGALLRELGAVGCKVSEGQCGRRFRVAGLQVDLRAAGLLKAKAIPVEYLRASANQRSALLQGLMDTGGTISASGQCEFTQVNKALSYQVLELAISLGLKATIAEGVASLNGRVIGPKYRVTFHPREDQPVFRLPRKLAGQMARHARRRLSADRRIVACDRVPSVPVRCITVDSPSSMFLAGRAMVPTHNSPMVAGIGLKMLVADGEPRAEVYAAATKKEQAQILFRDAVAMVDQSPDLDVTLKRSGGKGREWNIADPQSGSFFRTVASDSAQSGPRPHCALLDEVHEHKTGLMVEMMRAGTKNRRQALIVMITNSGTDRQSVCWTYHEYAAKVCAGQLEDDTFFGYVCSLDEGDDPFVDEGCWVKANPLLDVALPRKYLEEQVREARGMPSKESTVRRLNFCQWVESSNPLFGPEVWRAAADPEFDADRLVGRRCFGGLDLGSTTDLTAFALLFAPTADDQNWRQLVWYWMPEDQLSDKERRDRVPYTAWRAAGWVEATPGAAVDKRRVMARLVECTSRYDVVEIGFDRWRIEDFRMLMADEGVELPLVEFGQGFQSMSPAVDEYERLLVSGELKHDGNPIMTWNAASAVADTDPAGNRKLSKQKATGRIDGLVAAVMAAGVITTEVAAEPTVRWL